MGAVRQRKAMMDAERGIVLMLDVWCGFRVHVVLYWASSVECYRVLKGGGAGADIVLR